MYFTDRGIRVRRVYSGAGTPPNWTSPARGKPSTGSAPSPPNGPVTLLTATKDLDLSQAAVLAGLLRETT